MRLKVTVLILLDVTFYNSINNCSDELHDAGDDDDE